MAISLSLPLCVCTRGATAREEMGEKVNIKFSELSYTVERGVFKKSIHINIVSLTKVVSICATFSQLESRF